MIYDRADVGSSEGRPDHDVPKSYIHFAEELGRLLAGLAIDVPAVLIGHSFGCLIFRVFAACWPERVQGLVLVEDSVPGLLLWPESEPSYPRDGDRIDATHIDVRMGAEEVRRFHPGVPTIVLTKTPGRWTTPRATNELDDMWRRRQHERLAADLGAVHVFATDGGHRLNVEAPQAGALFLTPVRIQAAHGRVAP